MPTTAADPLYPEVAPYHADWLAVDGGHTLYYAQFGAPRGTPALFLHGGPGSGCRPAQARLFDPAGYRLIQLDQRGAGRSRPQGARHANDLDRLLGDLETLRRHLAIERWLVYGGSWGATLALEYAKRHPERVLALVLRAPFLARPEDLAWFVAPGGVARQLPTAYTALCRQLDCPTGDDLIGCLCRRLEASDADRAHAAARAWDTWEAAVMGLPPPDEDRDAARRRARIAGKRIFAHYAAARFFLGECGVLHDMERLAPLPTTIVHGTHDRVCRFSGSAALIACGLPGMRLRAVERAGHGLHEVALQRALRGELDAALQAHGAAAG